MKFIKMKRILEILLKTRNFLNQKFWGFQMLAELKTVYLSL